MSFSSSLFSSHAKRSRFAEAVGLLVLMTVPVSGAIFKNGFVDHSICCGSGGPLSMDGTALRGAGSSGSTLTAVSSGQETNKTASETPASAPSAPPKEVDGYLQLEFARLSDFKIESPAYNPDVKPEAALAAVDKQIPAAIKQFDGKQSQISGFMLPVKMEGQLVSQFLLLRDQMMCCYGVVPRINDWIVVHVAKPVRFTPDMPVSFRGKLQVKAMQEQGFVTGVYLLEEATQAKE